MEKRNLTLFRSYQNMDEPFCSWSLQYRNYYYPALAGISTMQQLPPSAITPGSCLYFY